MKNSQTIFFNWWENFDGNLLICCQLLAIFLLFTNILAILRAYGHHWVVLWESNLDFYFDFFNFLTSNILRNVTKDFETLGCKISVCRYFYPFLYEKIHLKILTERSAERKISLQNYFVQKEEFPLQFLSNLFKEGNFNENLEIFVMENIKQTHKNSELCWKISKICKS